jgi:hypothetical protein
MIQLAKSLLLAGVVLGVAFAPALAAEREQVRIVVNLVAAVKMPYPENLSRNRAKTQRAWLDLNGATIACLRLEARRWCFEHIPPVGARAEMLRIRNEPAGGVSVGQLYHYVDDFDLDGMIDVGSTTRIEPPERAPVANVIQFFHRATNRGEQFRSEYQRERSGGRPTTVSAPFPASAAALKRLVSFLGCNGRSSLPTRKSTGLTARKPGDVRAVS